MAEDEKRLWWRLVGEEERLVVHAGGQGVQQHALKLLPLRGEDVKGQAPSQRHFHQLAARRRKDKAGNGGGGGAPRSGSGGVLCADVIATDDPSEEAAWADLDRLLADRSGLHAFRVCVAPLTTASPARWRKYLYSNMRRGTIHAQEVASVVCACSICLAVCTIPLIHTSHPLATSPMHNHAHTHTHTCCSACSPVVQSFLDDEASEHCLNFYLACKYFATAPSSSTPEIAALVSVSALMHAVTACPHPQSTTPDRLKPRSNSRLAPCSS